MDQTDEEKAKARGIDPRLFALYSMLPSPPQSGAPIDQLLQLLNPVGSVGGAVGAAMPGMLKTILAGVGRAAAPDSTVYDQFGSPVESSIHSSLNEKTGKVQQFRIDPVSEYPPPGVDPTQWALDNPPPANQRLPEGPTSDDSAPRMEPQWYGPPEGGETVVAKTQPDPSVVEAITNAFIKRHEAMAEEASIIDGLGGNTETPPPLPTRKPKAAKPTANNELPWLR